MTILVPVGSAGIRDRVLDVAIRLGQGLDEDLYVVHLVEDEVADGEAKRIRDELDDRLVEAGVVATVALEYVSHSGPRAGPRIGQEVLDLAADVDITHIVMGHSEKGLLRGITQGSVAFAVADAAAVPVTIVPDTVEGER